MSLRAFIWALDTEAKPSLKRFVLLALADAATERFKSYPSVAALCKFTAQTPATVEDNLQGLINDGIISDTGQRVGPEQNIRVFQLNCEQLKPVQAPLLKPKMPKERNIAPEMAEAYAIYAVYPRPVDPKRATRSIAKAIKQYGFEIVMNGTKNFADAWKASGKAKEFCPHPTTYFNNDRFTARLEDLGLPVKKDGKADTTPHGPTAAEFQKHASEKYGKELQIWTLGFFAHWQKRKWMENGQPIDWQIRLSTHINEARTKQEKIAAEIANPGQ